MKKITIYISLIISVLACNKENEFNELRQDQVKAEVRQMLENYFEAIRASGLTAEYEYLDQSTQFFWVPPGFESAISFDSVKTILDSNAKMIKSIEFKWDTLHILPLSENIANYTGIISGRTVSVQDSVTMIRMIETGTVIRNKSKWKILSGQSRNL